MEDLLVEKRELYTTVRASYLTISETSKEIRVGIECSYHRRESTVIRSTIPREDVRK